MHILSLACVILAGFWSFSSNTEEEEKVRLSTLMEPATVAIEDADDLAYDGKMSEAVDKYREALEILDRLESENPERAATPEFASVRNKRAYVTATIDSILLLQARNNARAVAITDTTELEKKYAKRQQEKREKRLNRAKGGEEKGGEEK